MSSSVNFDAEEPLTSSVKPLTNATITVRVIKSFPYRNVKNIIFNDYNLMEKTVQDLKTDSLSHIKATGAFRAFRNIEFDTLKIYTHAHGSKTVNLIINFDHDEDWMLQDLSKKLVNYDIGNETEISLFNMKDYHEYKANPEEKWL
ncbi:LAME_0D01596g1_1 [Lachancea meyersii CBS 8951]|uniref:LAME_0D01596g1_1 n=1 Tax=Lachancea meyersii CBS 8951 TaxID=1266667 RepID=A0A1G4J6Y6_9SACH|nr:LAME_0D01596g1_1 [Lachancea meyersii CBS 8951]